MPGSTGHVSEALTWSLLRWWAGGTTVDGAVPGTRDVSLEKPQLIASCWLPWRIPNTNSASKGDQELREFDYLSNSTAPKGDFKRWKDSCHSVRAHTQTQWGFC